MNSLVPTTRPAVLPGAKTKDLPSLLGGRVRPRIDSSRSRRPHGYGAPSNPAPGPPVGLPSASAVVHVWNPDGLTRRALGVSYRAGQKIARPAGSGPSAGWDRVLECPPQS